MTPYFIVSGRQAKSVDIKIFGGSNVGPMIACGMNFVPIIQLHAQDLQYTSAHIPEAERVDEIQIRIEDAYVFRCTTCNTIL